MSDAQRIELLEGRVRSLGFTSSPEVVGCLHAELLLAILKELREIRLNQR